jgi:Na+-translocating ferredoxin:NAD+ oxidoreductase RnfC subunit
LSNQHSNALPKISTTSCRACICILPSNLAREKLQFLNASRLYRFEKLMKKFKKELEDSLKKLDKEIKKLIDAGVLKKDKLNL